MDKIRWLRRRENDVKQVKVIKVDKDNNEVKLECVEFEVSDENDKVLEKIITDENGEALTSRYAIRDFAKLKAVLPVNMVCWKNLKKF